MLGFTKSLSANTGFFTRFFARASEEIIKKCDEVIDRVVRPVLQQEGNDIIFHGIEDKCAIITLEGEAAICTCEKCSSIPEEVLQLLKHFYPDDITDIRRKLEYED